MGVRLIIFVIFIIFGCVGIVSLSEMEVFLTSNGVDKNEVKLFISLFQILYIELILLGIYSVFYRGKSITENERASEEPVLSRSIIDEFKRYWSSLYSTDNKGETPITGVLGPTLAISTSVTIAIQITVSVSNINPPNSDKISADLKQYIENSITAEAKRISDKIDPLRVDIIKLNSLISSLDSRPESIPATHLNEETVKKLTDSIKDISESLEKVPLALNNLVNSSKDKLTADSYKEGIKTLAGEYSRHSKRNNEVYQEETLKILERLDIQNSSIGEIKLTKEAIAGIKSLQCSEINVLPTFLQKFYPEDAREACRVKSHNK